MTQPSQSGDRRIKHHHCPMCGMATHDESEFHPHVFCVLKKAGRDPWVDIVDVAGAWMPACVTWSRCRRARCKTIVSEALGTPFAATPKVAQ